MSINKSFLVVLLFCTVVAAAQYSVPTINVNREFSNWKDSGVNCDTNTSNFWYVFKTEIDTSIKKMVRYCGGSVLYIGLKNNLHLYNQSLIVSCDSVASFLKQDSNFINILPLVAEEKVSYEIYKDSGLYYVDSVNFIFKARVSFTKDVTVDIYSFIKTVVDSVEGSWSNTFIYGKRKEMLLIAANKFIETISDIKKENPLNIGDYKHSKFTPNLKLKDQAKCNGKTFELNGKICNSIKKPLSVKVVEGIKKIIK